MPQIVKIPIDGVEDLLLANAYGAGALVRLESGATSGGAFTSVSTANLVAGTYLYTIADSAGSASTWYRWRIENAGGTRLSAYTGPFQVAFEADQLCSLYDVKQRLNIGATDTTDDEFLVSAIVQITSEIHAIADRSFLPGPISGTKVLLRDGSDSLEDGRLLPFPEGLISVSQLEIAPYTGASFSTIPSSDYFLRPTSEARSPEWPATELWMTDVPVASNPYPYFPDGFANVRITGQTGFAAVPGVIRRIAENVTIRHYQAKASGSTDRVGGGDFGGRLLRWVSPEEAAIIASRFAYRTAWVI